jgi:hypothetical protein
LSRAGDRVLGEELRVETCSGRDALLSVPTPIRPFPHIDTSHTLARIRQVGRKEKTGRGTFTCTHTAVNKLAWFLMLVSWVVYVSYLILRKKHELQAFQNKTLRQIFLIKEDEVIWEPRKLHGTCSYLGTT